MNVAILIAVLIQVESGGDDGAIGDSGQAVGSLQLHEAFVLDANRILGTDYGYDDRLNRAASVHMATGWIIHYANHYEDMTDEDATYEVMARIFNGGFRGYCRNPKATDAYWAKVEPLLNKYE